MKLRYLVVALSILVVCATAIALTLSRGAAKGAAETADTEAKHKAEEGVVTLGDEKLGSMDIHVAPVSRRPMQEIHVVPARIQYDDSRHVEIRAAANGILMQILVSLGDRVAAGQVLGIASSPEVGLARTDVHHARESWELASKKQQWVEETSKNVAMLVGELKDRVAMNEIERQFKEKTLGRQRESLLAAYSKFLLAQNLANSADTVGRNVLPTATIVERQSARRTAEAALRAACEQAGFDVLQQKRAAEIETGDALRRLHIAEERRTALLGYSPDTVPEDATAGDQLSRVEIRAPFAGTIEDRRFAQSERIKTSDTIFVLADTKLLWVVADLREQDWAALRLKAGEEISVGIPAMPGYQLKARIKRSGRQVATETNSLALVAEIANPEGLLRPGLFAQVSLPIGARRDVLCVSPSAVVQHEGAKFVFLQKGPKTFARADVTTGLETDGLVEIVSGIAERAPVVVQGAMALKSEMLIETLAKED